MIGNLSLVTGPSTLPVSLTDMKSHLRVDITDDDGLIQTLVEVVRSDMEKKYDTAFISQTWDWYLDDFPGTVFTLPIWPVSSLTSIKYTDEDDNESTYSSANYRLDTVSKPARVTLKTGSSWPSVSLKEINGVVIRFVAGYGASDSAVPEPVKQAIKLAVGDLYENRENVIVGSGLNIKDMGVVESIMMNYRSFHV